MASSYQSDSKETSLYVPGQGANRATLRASWSESNANVNNNTTDITVTGYIYNSSAAYNSSDGAKMYVYWHDNKTGTNRAIPGSPLTVSQMGDGTKVFYGSKSLTGTITVEHNADGTASGYAYVVWDKLKGFNLIPDDGSVSTSNHELYTIPRKSSISLDSTTKTTGQTLTVTITKASSGFTSTVRWAFGNQSGIIGTAKTSATSVAWSIPASVLTEIPNASSGTGTITCETFNGDTSLGSVSSSITIQAASSVTPTISSSSISDGNSKWSNVYVQSKSFLVAAISASGVQGSTITQYRVSMDGIDYNGATVAEVNTKLRNAALVPQTSKTITIRVTDSRGRYKEATKTINVYAYTAPSITDISVFRSNASRVEDGDGSYATCGFKASVSSCNSNNRMQIKIYWKIYGATTYPSANVTTIQSLSKNPQSVDKTSGTNRPILSNITTAHSWTIKIEVVDDFETTYIERDVSAGFDLIHFNSTGTGIGIGKKSEKNNAIEMGQDTYFNKNIYVNNKKSFGYTSNQLKISQDIYDLLHPVGDIMENGDANFNPNTQATNLGVTATWEKIKGRMLIGSGSGMEANTDNTFGELRDNGYQFGVGSRGGQYTHVLTASEIASHNHTGTADWVSLAGNAYNLMWDDGRSGGMARDGIISIGGWTRNRSWSGTNGDASRSLGINASHSHNLTINNNANADGPHSNMPPYVVVNIWKRTA